MATRTGQNAAAANAPRKKMQFRDTRLGVVPNTIDALSRLTVDAATKAALTAAGVKLTVEIDTAGTRVFLADQRTGQLVGGSEDLARLGGIRSFVNRERKDALGVEVAREVTQLAFKASTKLAMMEPGYTQVPLDASYGAATRPLLSVVQVLEDNQKKLAENTNPASSEILKPMLDGFFEKVKQVYFHLILLHTRGENTKGKLQELLFESGVPEFVHTRITNRALVLDRGQELARVLFPSDPSKGISLTLKEWRDPTFRAKLGMSLLGGSHLVSKLVNDSNFLRAICKIDSSISLEDETNPSVAKLLKCRVAVIPPMLDSRYVTEPASKSKAGWKFPSPSMDSIQGAINALSTAVIRMYSANMQSVDLVGDFYATIVPGAVSRAAVSPTNNFYVQWANATNPTGVWADHVVGGTTGLFRANVWRWIRTEMRLSEKAEGGISLARALILNDDGTPKADVSREIEVQEPDPNNKDRTILVKKVEMYYPPLEGATNRPRTYSLPVAGKINLLSPLSATEEAFWREFQKANFPSKKKGKKTVAMMGNTLTRLTPEGLGLAEEIKEKSSPLLAERMRQWLRGFSDERVQRAAVKLANASFDELFILEENEDSDDDEESSDDEE